MEIVLFMSCLWDIKGKAPASYQSLLMLTGCQGMGSWQECGCKIDLTCVCVCVCLFQLKCESKMSDFLNTMFI